MIGAWLMLNCCITGQFYPIDGSCFEQYSQFVSFSEM